MSCLLLQMGQNVPHKIAIRSQQPIERANLGRGEYKQGMTGRLHPLSTSTSRDAKAAGQHDGNQRSQYVRNPVIVPMALHITQVLA